MKPPGGLPRRQDALLRLIGRHERNGMVPAAAVLAQEMGLAGESSVTPALRALQAKGFLSVEGGVRGRQRFIRLTESAHLYLGDGLPVVEAQGRASLEAALRRPQRVVRRLEDLLSFGPGDYLLQVRGDSMRDAGVLDGDLLLLRRGAPPRAGDLVALWVEDGVGLALKRVHAEAGTGKVRLVEGSGGGPGPTLSASESHLAGVVRGLVRGC